MKKILIILLIVFLCLIGVGVIIMISLPQKIPVITYHNFLKNGEEKTMIMSIYEDEFEEHMKYLANHNYHSLTLKEVECFMDGTCDIPKKSVLITIDDGWRSTISIAAPILEKCKLNAVLFYIGKNINGENSHFLNKNDIGILRKKYPNIEIASHTYDLHNEDAYTLSKKELEVDMEKMKRVISNEYFAYPYGKHSNSYHKALEEEGYKLAFTFGPDEEHRKMSKSDDKLQIPRLNMSDGMPLWKFILRLKWYK